jgi:apolipoprotein N-acyltransferase
MAWFAQSLRELNRWQATIVAFAAGSLLSLGFAPFHYWPVVFASLPVFYLLLQSAMSRGQALWRGFAFGYGFFMAGTWWIANALLVDADKFAWMLPFSILGLSAVMALWFMVFGYLVYKLRARMSPLVFAVLWVIVEILRSIGIFGFPWNLAGYISLASLEFAQVASIIGVYGLSFIVVWIGLLPVYWAGAQTHPRQQRRIVSILAFAIIIGCYSFGLHQLSTPTAYTTTMLRIVQPSIPQEIKGTSEGQEVAAKLLGDLTKKPSQARKGGDDSLVTIWPETAYPLTVRVGEKHPLPKLDGVLLTGAVRAEGARPNLKVWNSIIAMNGEGEVLATYDKHQLVPFGEFVPLRSVLPLDKITPGDIDFSRGAGAQTLNVKGIPPFSPLVCYEAIFPWMAVDAKNRPQWILNVTNDAWYGDTAGPYQHFDMTRMRAIEQGLPMVRAANNGISAVIDGRGRVIRSLPLGSRGSMDIFLPQ